MNAGEEPQPALRDLMADRARDLLVLNAVAAAVAQSLEPQPLLVNALDHVIDLLALDAGAIYTRRDDGHLALIAARGLAASLTARYQRLRAEHALVARLLRERRPLLLDDLRSVSALVPLAQAGFRTLLALQLVARGEVVGLLVVVRTTSAWSARETSLLEAIADHIGLALDNARLFAAEQQRRRQSEALRKGALALTEALGLDAVLQRIAQQATQLMEAPICTIFEYDDTSEQLVPRDPVCAPAERDSGWLAAGERIAREAVVRQRAVRSADLPLTTGGQPYTSGSAQLSASLLAAPLMVKGRIYGAIVVGHAAAREFSADELQLIDIFADQAALALEHARLVDQTRRLAALEERQRIARDLHDSVTQSLFSLRLAAEAASATLATDQQATAQMLQTVQELAGNALAEMRALIFELRPGALHEAGLAAAIERFVGAFRARTGLQVALDLDQRRSPPVVEEALYRIASEALHNIGKHARARQVAITLRRRHNSVCLVVQDDGVGFDPTHPVAGDHMGQRTMQERAAALGGSCVVQSAPGAGTRVVVEIPLQPYTS
ncbi:GAF domain-containing sensor histidine kinase [Kallotenue papyrolyticum]|uniref:GAF domain-containing sensor histidine kinase n=1 Tax=Kallotenue papyrolyticum TaxID=1325125 RepID=UPI000478550A|nr:GAF domain-containing protein [Kallotenue papyrolyticum]